MREKISRLPECSMRVLFRRRYAGSLALAMPSLVLAGGGDGKGGR